MAAHLNGGAYGGKRILSRESTEEMRRQQSELRPYGLGVGMANVNGREVIHHSGAIPGFHAILVADPSSRQGVYVMANAGGAGDAIGRLARHAMQLMWGDAVEDSKRAEITLSPEILDEYVGEYALTPSSSLTVSREGDRLFVRMNGRPRTEVFASSETQFFLKQGQGRVSFGRDAEGGPVTHLILHKVRGDQRADRVR